MRKIRGRECENTGKERKKTLLRWPGIEPGSTAWKAAMLTTIPPTPAYKRLPARHSTAALAGLSCRGALPRLPLPSSEQGGSEL